MIVPLTELAMEQREHVHVTQAILAVVAILVPQDMEDILIVIMLKVVPMIVLHMVLVIPKLEIVLVILLSLVLIVILAFLAIQIQVKDVGPLFLVFLLIVIHKVPAIREPETVIVIWVGLEMVVPPVRFFFFSFFSS